MMKRRPILYAVEKEKYNFLSLKKNQKNSRLMGVLTGMAAPQSEPNLEDGLPEFSYSVSSLICKFSENRRKFFMSIYLFFILVLAP